MKTSISIFLSMLFANILLLGCGGALDSPKVIVDSVPQKPKVPVGIVLKPGLVDGVEIQKTGQTSYDDLIGKKGDTIYYSSYKGKIEYSDTISKTRHPILDLNVIFLLNKGYLIPLPDDKWFVFWEETSYQGINSFAALFKTGIPKPIWKIRFINPNPSMPVKDGEEVYLATMGMAAKLSIADGNVIWRRDSLYNPYKLSFQNMQKPLVFPDKVIFIDETVRGRKPFNDSLFLDPMTGKRKK